MTLTGPFQPPYPYRSIQNMEGKLMSHIADLMRMESFKTDGALSGSIKSLKRRKCVSVAAVAFAGGFGLAAWHAMASTAPTVVAPPPVPVTVAAVSAQPVRLWSEFSGRMTAVDS